MSLLAPGSGIVAGLLQGSPTVPDFHPINMQDQQAKAIAGNQAVTSGLESQAAGINKFNQQQLQQMLQASIPGYETMKGEASGNIEAMLRGEIPNDVSQAVERGSAGRSLEGGYAGTGMGGNLSARDLGLTSLDLTQKGLSSAESWMKTISSMEDPALFDFTKMFVSPGEQAALAVEERDSQFQHDWTKNQVDWQGSLGYMAGADLRQTDAQANEVVGSMMGNAAGGGGM